MSSPATRSSSPSGSAPADDASPAGERRSWGALVAILAFVATIGATIFTSIPTLAIGDDTNAAKATGSVVGSIIQNAVFVGLPVFIVGRLIGGLRLRDVWLDVPRKAWRIPLFVIGAFVAYQLVSAGLAELIGAGGQEDSLPEDLGAKGSLTAGIAIGLAVTTLAPIGEEFLLRGIFYGGLRDSFARVMPLWIAVAIAAVIDGLLFGLLHIGGTDLIFLPILALFGIVLCLVLQLTRSLYACILLHATNNTIAIAVALDWSVLGGVALWVAAVGILGLIAAIAVRGDAALPPRGPAPPGPVLAPRPR